MTQDTEFAIQPETEAIFNLIQLDKLDEARGHADALLVQQPESAIGLYLRGMIYKMEGDVGKALSFFNSALKRKPDFKRACSDLAFTLQQAGKLELAFKTYEHLIRIEQNATQAVKAAPLTAASEKAMAEWNAQAQAFYKKGQLEKAVEMFRKALAVSPHHADMLVSLSVVQWALGKHDEVEELLLRCLKNQPNYAPALNQLGNAYKERRYLSKAIAAYRLAHAAEPSYRQPLANMGKTYFELQLFTESIDAYERTLKVAPDHLEVLQELTYLRQMLCRWEKLAECKASIIQAIETGQQCGEPFIAMIYVSAKLQFENAKRWALKLFPGGLPWKRNFALPALKRADGKLRVGYLSSDFQRHATLVLISEIFEHHDRGKFEIYAYSYGVNDGGQERVRIRESVDCFRDLYNVDDERACGVIENDKIDILIDLKGFTQNHRLGLLARRPAPVQMHYLGFPGTTGSVFIDYFIADHVAAPENLDPYFTEKLIRLPNSYQINDRKRPLPQEGPTRVAYGLPEKGFVFCALNNTYKIMPEMFDIWLRLLQNVEGSVLWVLQSHPESTENLRRVAEQKGVDPKRIVPAKHSSLAKHLARYRFADLFLDTTPICGHTTSSDALWCGVPVVTLLGESFIARVAAGLLHAVGLPELIAHSLEEYEALALSIAQNPEKLASLRKHLNDGRMRFSLFDSAGTTRALEAAYKHAANLQAESKAPEAFALNPDLTVA